MRHSPGRMRKKMPRRYVTGAASHVNYKMPSGEPEQLLEAGAANRSRAAPEDVTDNVHGITDVDLAVAVGVAFL